jgi:hypothetical protein
MDQRQQLEYAYGRLFDLYQSGNIRDAELAELQRLDGVLRPIWTEEDAAKLQQGPPMSAKENIAQFLTETIPVMRTPSWLRDPAISDEMYKRQDYQNAVRNMGILDFIPGVSAATSFSDSAIDANAGNAGGAAANVALGLLDAIPTVAYLRKAGKPAVKGLIEGMVDVPDHPITRSYFADRLAAAQATHGPVGRSVDIYSPDDYAGMRMAMTPAGDAGYVVKPDGEIASVVKAKGSPFKDFSGAVMRRSEDQGGNWLNAFDTALTGMYGRAGFEPVSRLPFSEDVARSGWGDDVADAFMAANKGYNSGRPDLVFMARNPSMFGPMVAPGLGGKMTNDWDVATQMLDARLKELGYR